MGVDLECVRVNNDNIIFWWIFPLDFMKDFRHAVKVKTIWIVSSSLLMWHRLFPALSKCELYIEHCCRYWTLFSSICPLSVSLINDLITGTLSVVLCSFGCHLWEILPWMGKKGDQKKVLVFPRVLEQALVITSLCQSVNSIASSHLCSPAGFFQCCLDKWIFALTRMCPLKMGGTRTFGLTFHQALVTSSGSHGHIA